MATIDDLATAATLMRKEAESERKKRASFKKPELREGILKDGTFYEWVETGHHWCSRCTPPNCGSGFEPCKLFSNGGNGRFRKAEINKGKGGNQ